MMAHGGAPGGASVVDGLLAVITDPAEMAKRLETLRAAQEAHDSAAATASAAISEAKAIKAEVATRHAAAQDREAACAAREAKLGTDEIDLRTRISAVAARESSVTAREHDLATAEILVFSKQKANQDALDEATATGEAALAEKRRNLDDRESTLDARDRRLIDIEETLAAKLAAVDADRAEYEKKLNGLRAIVA